MASNGQAPATVKVRRSASSDESGNSDDGDRDTELKHVILHKVIIIGDSEAGKTSLLIRFDQGRFSNGGISATVGIGYAVMLVGDSSVGKTCLLVKFRDGTFLSGSFISTVGIDFRNKIVDVEGTKVKLQIWDTAGQERFRSITRSYYRDAEALLLVYDITNKQSFDNIRNWLTEIQEYAKENVIIMLLGNKADMTQQRVIKTEDGERLAEEAGITFMETSAKTGDNVNLAFTALARALKDLSTNSSLSQSSTRMSLKRYISKETPQSGCSAC